MVTGYLKQQKQGRNQMTKKTGQSDCSLCIPEMYGHKDAINAIDEVQARQR